MPLGIIESILQKNMLSDASISEKYTVVTYGVCDDARRHLPWAWTVSGFVRPLQYVPAEGLKSPQKFKQM